MSSDSSSDSENDTRRNHLPLPPSERNGRQNDGQPASSEYGGASFFPDETVPDNETIHARFEQDPEGYANGMFLPDLVQRIRRDQEYRRRFTGTDTGVSGGAADGGDPFPDPLSHSVLVLLREVYARHLREVYARRFTRGSFRSQNPYVAQITRYIRHFEEQRLFVGNGWRQFDHYIRREVLIPFLSGQSLPRTSEPYRQALRKETAFPEAEKNLANSERNDTLPAANIPSFTPDMGHGESEPPAPPPPAPPPTPTDREVAQQTEIEQLRKENAGLQARLQEFRRKAEKFLSQNKQQEAVIAELRRQIQALELQLQLLETETGTPAPSESERPRPAAPEAVPEPSGALAGEEIHRAGEATGIDADILTECPKDLSAFDCKALRGWPDNREYTVGIDGKRRMENAEQYVKRILGTGEYGQLRLTTLKDINLKLYKALTMLKMRQGIAYPSCISTKSDVVTQQIEAVGENYRNLPYSEAIRIKSADYKRKQKAKKN